MMLAAQHAQLLYYKRPGIEQLKPCKDRSHHLCSIFITLHFI
jgi:hypothetical protein